MHKSMVPIADISSSQLSKTEEFLSSQLVLSELNERILHDHDMLKIHVEDFKKSRIKLIGNPFMKIQNSIFELTYLLKLHILNCRVYSDLLFDDVKIDEDLNLQLESLLATTQDLCDRYGVIRKALRDTPYPRRASI